MPSKKGSKQQNGKPRGAMAAYAYFIQTCREEHKLRYPDEAVIFSDFTNHCNVRWRTMTDHEKSRFCEMARKDKVRFDLERQSLLGAEAGGSHASSSAQKRSRSRKTRPKDPEAPKRPVSAFFWFTREAGPGIRLANPHYNLGDVSKKLSKQWSDMAANQRAPYEKKASDDKARYQKELAKYQRSSSKKGDAEAAVQPHYEEAAEEVDEAELVGEEVQRDVDDEMEEILEEP